MTLEGIKSSLRNENNLPLILITSYEHHSNEITWRNQICDVLVVPLNDSGFLDIEALEKMLVENKQKYNKIICSFSAGSNVTGIVTDVKESLFHC